MKFTNYNTEAKKRGMGGDFFNLADGENRIRVLTEMESLTQHFMGEGIKPVACQGEPHCEHCANGKRPNTKVMLYVLDRMDNKIKLAKLPWSIYRELSTLAESSEWGFKNLPPYDIIIKKSGKGLQTEYAVSPSRNEDPLSPAQDQELKDKKSIAEIVSNFNTGSREDAPLVYQEPIDASELKDVDLPF